MGVEIDLFEAAHRLARRYVRDGLSFWDALQEASRLDPAQGIERFKTSALYQLERALDAERAESRELRAEITGAGAAAGPRSRRERGLRARDGEPPLA
jgi:hypothetical protein